MNFSQLIQNIRLSETDRGRSGATFTGTPVTSANDLRESGSVAAYAKSQPSAQYKQLYREALRIVEGAMRGDRWMGLRLQEALTTSDFPYLFGDIIDRSVLANYAETPYSWPAYIKRATISDFRQAKIFRVDRGAAVLDGPIIPNSYGASGAGSTGIEQISEYPMRKRVDGGYTDQIFKFGARMDFAWETMLNDDLDALKDTPALFGRASRRTEEKRATSLFVSSTGPNATFYTTALGNLLSSVGPAGAGTFPFVTTINAPLSVTSLAWALIILASQLDLDGEPISIESYTLVVPPALDITARNIVNATQIWMNDQGGTVASNTSAQRLITQNWAAGRVTPVVNYYLPIVNTTSGNTAWYIFANPNSGRPAAQQSFLRGHEGPEMFMKSPNQVAIGEGRMGPGAGSMPGSGLTNPMEGDFETDGIAYKVRLCLGGTLLDSKMSVASTGAGS